MRSISFFLFHKNTDISLTVLYQIAVETRMTIHSTSAAWFSCSATELEALAGRRSLWPTLLPSLKAVFSPCR